MPLDARRIEQLVADRLDAHAEALDDYLASGPTPPGLQPVDDATFAEFVQQMVQQYPPAPYLFPILNPDGTPVLDLAGEPATQLRVVSPWIAMLALKKLPPSEQAGQPLVDGGEALLRRIERVMGPEVLNG